MKVVCPECSAVFDVPVPILGEGRRVRCAMCGHTWFQTPAVASSSGENAAFSGFGGLDEELAIEPIPASVHPHGHDDRDDAGHDAGPSFLETINWAYLGRMIAGFVAGAAAVFVISFALSKMGVMPLSSNDSFIGLEIHDLSAGMAEDTDGRPVTEVKGKIVNTSSETHDVPELDIIPMDADDGDGEAMRIKLEQESLKSGESADFAAQLQGEREAGANIHLRFIP